MTQGMHSALLQLKLLLLFRFDLQLECLNDLGVNIVKADVDLDIKLLYNARGHLPDFLINLYEVQVDDESSLSILQTHLIKLLQHHCDQQIIRLVDLEEVNEDQIDDALQESVGLAILFLLEYLQDALNEEVYAAEY